MSTDSLIQETVKSMINQIKILQTIVGAKALPRQLEQINISLLKLDHDIEKDSAITEYFKDRSNSSLANRAR